MREGAEVSVPLSTQIAEVKREIAMRENLYAKWIASGRMRRTEADERIANMTAVFHTLLRLQETS